jgi:monovalent cation:H+ antiporter-2, CPA2 family
MVPQAHEASQIFIELGGAIIGLALLGRLANRIGFSSIPLYLLLGLAFGNGSLAPLKVSEEFIRIAPSGPIAEKSERLTGYWAGRRAGIDRRGRIRAGMTLVARGEFSIVIAGLGAGVSPLLGPVAAAYVLFLAILGPVLARVSP